jgi:predicted secreted protein
MTDNRSQRIILIAHCLLNQNAKVKGLASYPGVFSPIISTIENAGVGIVQLPCPEFLHLGPLRPIGTDTVEQYNTPEYRDVCQEISLRTAAEVISYQKAGYQVVCFLGVEGLL